MYSSIKARESDKRRLDRLQTQVSARRGRRITQQDLLGRLLDLGETELDRLANELPPPNDPRWKRLPHFRSRTGVRTREEDINRTLYGVKA